MAGTASLRASLGLPPADDVVGLAGLYEPSPTGQALSPRATALMQALSAALDA